MICSIVWSLIDVKIQTQWFWDRFPLVGMKYLIISFPCYGESRSVLIVAECHKTRFSFFSAFTVMCRI